MEYTRKLIQERPSADEVFFTLDSDMKNLISSYISSGKILENYTSVTSDTGLQNTITIRFNSIQSYIEFSKESTSTRSRFNREQHCNIHNISSRTENTEN